ncbi:MAG: hypothetical protein LQ351_005566 [Letrouitia transgressa]|nr:MAG: hypothetical protein LQ351_005566 [Letrouitia transgressa]
MPSSSPAPSLSPRSASVIRQPSSPSTSPTTTTPAAPEDTATDPSDKPFSPRLAYAGDGRRPSIQFATAATNNNHPKNEVKVIEPTAGGSPKALPARIQRRLSSPPPPSKYERRVSFNTFDNRDATDYSFNLIAKHKHYNYSQRSRTFLCGTDENDYSEFALQWLLDELVEDGDEVVCLRVVDKDSKMASSSSMREGRYKKEAEKLLEDIKNKNKEDEKAINLILEFAVGKVPETIQRMIQVYSPVCLIVGTRGRPLGGVQALLPGSVSKYCLQNSPVPVVVVRPSAKRLRKKKKRLADDKRRGYQDVLELSGAKGSQSLNKSEMDKLVGETGGEASEQEAEAVAKAIGLSKSLASLPGLRKGPTSVADDAEGAPLSRAQSARSDYTTSGADSPSPEGGLAPDPGFLGEETSPDFEPLDSPVISGEEAEDEKEESSKVEGKEDEKQDEEGARGWLAREEQAQGQKRTGAKRFVFPKGRRSSSPGLKGASQRT